MLKKLWLDIRIFLHGLFVGMRAADSQITGGGKNDSGDGTSIEKKQEVNNLYAALLRGEVTQEVREARHEMYYAERKSKDYVYNGGGNAKKKNNLFDYEGHIENSDNHTVQIVQDNYQDQASLEDYGVDIGKVDESGSSIYETIKMEDIAKKEYTIKIKRDFYPKFKLEEFTKKVVVKDFGEKRILDIYVSKYPTEFDRRSRMFVNMMNEIYEGNTRLDVIDFTNLSFISRNAYGTDDLRLYSFKDFSFSDIIDFDGNYVLRFVCTPEFFGDDLIQEFYDETAAKKSEEHARRENATIDMEAAAEIIARDSYDTETAENLIKQLNEGDSEIFDGTSEVHSGGDEVEKI